MGTKEPMSNPNYGDFLGKQIMYKDKEYTVWAIDATDFPNVTLYSKIDNDNINISWSEYKDLIDRTAPNA